MPPTSAAQNLVRVRAPKRKRRLGDDLLEAVASDRSLSGEETHRDSNGGKRRHKGSHAIDSQARAQSTVSDESSLRSSVSHPSSPTSVPHASEVTTEVVRKAVKEATAKWQGKGGGCRFCVRACDANVARLTRVATALGTNGAQPRLAHCLLTTLKLPTLHRACRTRQIACLPQGASGLRR